MKILIATDGSSHARVARDLVGSLDLPAGSSISVISVITAPSHAGLTGGLRARLLGQALGATGRDLERFAAPLRKLTNARTVTVVPLEGRAAQTILAQARRMKADLIVVGSRGHGAIRSTLFGSVAGEVVEGAPCPVLVARTRRVRRIVHAEDGSSWARRATTLVERGLFGRPPVTVVSAWRVAVPFSEPEDPVVDGLVMRQYEREVQSERRSHTRVAAAAAVARLKRGGLPQVTAVVREGNPTAVILAVTKAKRADLITLGTRGRSEVASIVLGSVARGVLYGSKASLLVTPRQRSRSST